jgi:very-short-patch-repair endonuclease
MNVYDFKKKLIEEEFNAKKRNVVTFIKKHFVKDTDYITVHPNKKNTNSNKGGGSGLNKIDYFLTDNAYKLLKASYSMRTSDLGKLSLTHPIIPPIETAAISFICDVFRDFKYKKQFNVNNKYYIDLYFIDLKLAIECDEDHHLSRFDEDTIRESYIKTELNCKFYRFNPSKTTLSNIVYDIMKIIYTYKLDDDEVVESFEIKKMDEYEEVKTDAPDKHVDSHSPVEPCMLTISFLKKHCGSCDQTHDIDMFNRDSTKKDGRTSTCRAC